VLVYARGVEYDKTLDWAGCALWHPDVVDSERAVFLHRLRGPTVPAVLMSKQVLAELGAKIVVGIVTALVYGKGGKIQTVREVFPIFLSAFHEGGF